MSVNYSIAKSYCCFTQMFFPAISLKSRACKNYHFIFSVGTSSLESRNIKLVNRITFIIEESKFIKKHVPSNVVYC